MVRRTPTAPVSLYETDETAWLDATAALVRRGRLDEVDTTSLAEYLEDMAAGDRREVVNRLVSLLAHILKSGHQPDQRSGSCRAKMIEQRQELEGLAGRGVLRNHAEAVLADAYRKAVERAAGETGLPAAAFPATCPYTLDELLATDVLGDDA